VDRDDGEGATATVDFPTEHSARIDMRDEAGRHAVREVAFREEDPVEDRWQTIALLVASLASEQSGAPASHDARPSHVLWLSLLGEAGDGVVPGPPRFGGSAQLAFRPRGFIGYFSAGIGYATSVRTVDGVRPTFMPLSLGVGAVIEFERAPLILRPRLDLLVERQGASITGDGADQTSDARWLPGVGASVDLVVPTRSPFSIVFGAEGRFLDGATTIRVKNERVGSFPAHSYGVHLGIDVALDGLFGLAGD
jgi:hypothetical protein